MGSSVSSFRGFNSIRKDLLLEREIRGKIGNNVNYPRLILFVSIYIHKYVYIYKIDNSV